MRDGYDVRAADPFDDGDCAALAVLRWTWRVGEGEAAGRTIDSFLPDFAEWWRRHAASHRAWIAARAGRPVGMAWLGQVDRLPSPDRPARRGGMVQSVFVLPDHRDHGVGAELIHTVTVAARDAGMDWLIVHPTQRSKPFYRRAGFGETDGLLELRPIGTD